METTQSQYEFLQPAVSESDSLLVTLFFAAVIHIFLLLGISFAIPKAERANSQIEITLSSSPSKKAPENAKFLAKDNQLGAGDELKKPTPPKLQIASQGQNQNKPPRPNEMQIESKPQAVEKLITQKETEQKIVQTKKITPPSEKEHKRLTKESLKRDVAQLGEEMMRLEEKSSEETRIKFVNSVNTHKYLAAEYVNHLVNKIKRTGNLNFPKSIRKIGSVKLTMDIAINSDGSIYKMRIVKSSGESSADAAAKRIVRLSAPFSNLPKKLLEEVDILVITRVFTFSDETGVTTN